MPSRVNGSEPRVLVLTRPGCHLCEEAIAVVESIVAETGDSYEERNVDRDPELLRRYSEQVPVIFVDGRQHDFWRVDPARLRAALRKAR
jgi:glutaredoxin